MLDAESSFFLAAASRLDCRDVDLFHLHHRVECAFGYYWIGTHGCLRQGQWRYLPGHAPFVFAPAAHALLPAITDDRVPVAIGFDLVFGCHLKRERFALLEMRPTIQADAGNAHHGKFHYEHITLFSR